MKKYNKEDDEKVWFGQLYGMGDNISFNLASKGFNVKNITFWSSRKFNAISNS